MKAPSAGGSTAINSQLAANGHQATTMRLQPNWLTAVCKRSMGKLFPKM
jgi:hypothetical protein